MLELGRSYQSSAIMLAAAELDVFGALSKRPGTAASTASALGCDVRAMTILLDALAALRLLIKTAEEYTLAPGVAETLTAESPRTVLAMAQHQANCLRNWAQLAMVVKTGVPAPDLPTVQGERGNQEAFIGAMHNISQPVADAVIQALAPFNFTHLLDVGGASGTWTMALLRACPGARATLFDLPHVMPMARQRLEASGFGSRVTLVPGDFYTDPLPAHADLVWISAIVHQNSRAENRALFSKAFKCLEPGGEVAVRDILMETDRTWPTAGALFAINMLTATDSGGTFTLDELQEDLESAGFGNVRVARRDPAMNSIIVAERPGRTAA